MKPIFFVGLFMASCVSVYAQELYYQATEYSFKKAISESLFAETRIGENTSGSSIDIDVMAKLVRDSRVFVAIEDSRAMTLKYVNNKKECEVHNLKELMKRTSNVLSSAKWPLAFDYRVKSLGVMRFEKVNPLKEDSELVMSIKEACDMNK